MDIINVMKKRYAVKKFDKTKKISEDKINTLLEIIRLSPSSINSQPWHFVVAKSDEAKEKISKSTEGFYESNKDKVLECSHVIVLCIKSRMDKSHLNKMIEQEVHDCRILNDKNKSIREMVCKNYINIHKYDLKDEQHWMEKQVYLNLGNILLGAELLEIDALPMEGFNKQVLDKELNLREQGYLSSVMVALGYKSNDDFNLSLPKSRFSKEDIFTIL